ncbi:hypothetical protein [Microvirga sp. HBU67558]|uniref:hypothetical protein n=1 Tax=Microvirga sp. HBU67558 TaxID=2824562 RepID=UPI001FFD832C|nr:hypothetical protein [Microvirga sp. HBU67558]
MPPIIGIIPGIMLPIMGIAAELVICLSLVCWSEVRQRFRCVEEKDEPGRVPQQRISLTGPLLSSNLMEVGPTDRTNRRFIGCTSALVDTPADHSTSLPNPSLC